MLSDDELGFFDKLAGLTRAPDASFEELRRLYQGDGRLRVPPTVFNALLNRPEEIVTATQVSWELPCRDEDLRCSNECH